jgi:hypothetical protein
MRDAYTRWQLNVTYRCNLACHECIQYLDKIKFTDCDIDLELVKLAGKMLKDRNITLGMTRISGGEPLLHKDILAITKEVADNWNTPKLVVCTNTVIKERPSLVGLEAPGGVKYRMSPPSWKEMRHRPCLISPKDLGMEPVAGFKSPCSVTTRCGRLLDKYGFSVCGNAASLGRLLRINPFHDKPIWFAPKEMCEHCVFTLPKPKRMEVWDMAENGKIPNPTKTFAEALERDKEDQFQLTPMKYTE